jgi:hypothetical protein
MIPSIEIFCLAINFLSLITIVSIRFISKNELTLFYSPVAISGLIMALLISRHSANRDTFAVMSIVLALASLAGVIGYLKLSSPKAGK